MGWSGLAIRLASMRATLAIRQAVRPWVESADARILIGVSGGADSLALALATHLECQAANIELVAIIIDHQLQPSADAVAARCSEQLHRLGLSKVEVVQVTVELRDGMEASARRARYQAFSAAIAKYNPDYFLLAHTKNDQAESVLLGLARGSGTRSLSGIAPENGRYIRPLLEIDRATTELACTENGLTPWVDPHNFDHEYARVRVRMEVLPTLERNLGPGIVDALSRSARILREDADALDLLADQYLLGRNPLDLEVTGLAGLPKAVRIRVLRGAIYSAGAPGGSLSAEHLAPVEALISDWHGQGGQGTQGGISLPGGVKVARISGRLSLSKQNQ